MAFQQFKLDIISDQTRGIFDSYVYSTPDTISDVVSAGYFAKSRFKDLSRRSFLLADCSDGFLISLVTQDLSLIHI